MKIAIVGFDVEGRATYDYFAAQSGHEITICDQNPNVEAPEGAQSVLGDSYLNHLSRFDLIVRTAGIPPQKILEQNPEVSGKMTTHVNEFFKASPTRNIIGVTGTKGKGTTSTLITKMLEAAGKDVQLGGNIGVPPLTFLDKLTSDSWVVLELSSFQLIDLQASPHIAVCLLVVAEHLNWHSDMDDYTIAKSQLFRRQTTDDIAIYYAENETSKRIASTGKGWKIPYMAFPGGTVKNDEIVIDNQTICKTSDVKLLGEHNLQNICAAVTAVWKVVQDIPAMQSVLTSFSGLPHRIELVREHEGIRYYDDSFSTGLHATQAAIASVPGSKVVILGGFDRMLDLDEFAAFAQKNQNEIRKALIIGASAERLAESLQAAGFTNYEVDKTADSMPKIVAKARSFAEQGDAVVLSPGFASFDLFKNFVDRGEQFTEVVNAL